MVMGFKKNERTKIQRSKIKDNRMRSNELTLATNASRSIVRKEQSAEQRLADKNFLQRFVNREIQQSQLK